MCVIKQERHKLYLQFSMQLSMHKDGNIDKQKFVELIQSGMYVAGRRGVGDQMSAAILCARNVSYRSSCIAHTHPCMAQK